MAQELSVVVDDGDDTESLDNLGISASAYVTEMSERVASRFRIQ